jgi:hypothetical protein
MIAAQRPEPTPDDRARRAAGESCAARDHGEPSSVPLFPSYQVETLSLMQASTSPPSGGQIRQFDTLMNSSRHESLSVAASHSAS